MVLSMKVLSMKVLSIAVFTIPKILINNLLSRLEYFILKYFILLTNTKLTVLFISKKKYSFEFTNKDQSMILISLSIPHPYIDNRREYRVRSFFR